MLELACTHTVQSEPDLFFFLVLDLRSQMQLYTFLFV